MLFSLLKHYLDLNITDTAMKVSRSLYCFTTSISHGVENYFPRLWVRASLMLFLNTNLNCCKNNFGSEVSSKTKIQKLPIIKIHGYHSTMIIIIK